LYDACPNPHDRRKVVFGPITENLPHVESLFLPMAHRLATFTPEQLRTVIEFTRRTNEVQEEENARLRWDKK
jgi:hypothetical protein